MALADGSLRFNALKRRLDGVSQKMLTQTLRHLERDGLVLRRVVDARPLSVEYELLPAEEKLLPIISALKAWAENHLFAVQRTNATFDKKAARSRRAS